MAYFYLWVSPSPCDMYAVLTDARKGYYVLLKLELRYSVSYQTWVLGTELVSSGRAASVPLSSISQPIVAVLSPVEDNFFSLMEILAGF